MYPKQTPTCDVIQLAVMRKLPAIQLLAIGIPHQSRELWETTATYNHI